MPLRNSGVVLKKLVLNRPHFNDSAAILTPPHIGAKAELLLLDVPQPEGTLAFTADLMPGTQELELSLVAILQKHYAQEPP